MLRTHSGGIFVGANRSRILTGILDVDLSAKEPISNSVCEILWFFSSGEQIGSKSAVSVMDFSALSDYESICLPIAVEKSLYFHITEYRSPGTTALRGRKWSVLVHVRSAWKPSGRSIARSMRSLIPWSNPFPSKHSSGVARDAQNYASRSTLTIAMHNNRFAKQR
jgi:hypothetical protein